MERSWEPSDLGTLLPPNVCAVHFLPHFISAHFRFFSSDIGTLPSGHIPLFAHFLFFFGLGPLPPPTMSTASLFCHISFFDPFSLSLSSDLGKLPTACIITAFFGRFVCFYFWHTCTTRTNGTHPLSPQYFVLHLGFCLRVCLLVGSSEMMLL